MKSKSRSFQSLEYVYHIACFIGAVVLIGRCVYIYHLDEDLNTTSYKTFHSNQDSIYPSINLCFGDIWKEEKLYLYGTSAANYKQYLKGELFSHNLSLIPFQDVTNDPLDYLLGIQMYQEMTNKNKNPSVKFFYDFSQKEKINDSFIKEFVHVDQFNNAWGTFYKCLSVDIPYLENKHLNWIGIILKKSIFKKRIRPMVVSGDSYFAVSLSYPDQRLRYRKEKTNWKNEIINGSYAMKFQIATLEVMKFRNKKLLPCDMNWKKDDKEIRRDLISKLKCIPPYWKQDFYIDYKDCSQTELKDLYSIVSWEREMKPCRVMSQLLFSNSEFPISFFDDKFESGYSGNYFVVYIYYPDNTYKEIRMVKAFDIETLIGNGGGYLGLFLGYSVLQLPVFVFWAVKKIWKVQKRNIQKEQIIKSIKINQSVVDFQVKDI